MKVTLLIPTLNEIDGMKTIMPQIKKEWYDQLLIVDGQSTDGTADYARNQGYEVIVQQKKGIRNAYIEALPHIKGDIILTFSPDGNSIPGLIPDCINKLKEGYDMVIGSRTLGVRERGSMLPQAIIGNWLACSLIRLFWGYRFTDLGPFRVVFVTVAAPARSPGSP